MLLHLLFIFSLAFTNSIVFILAARHLQAEELFGEQKNAILPVVSDIAGRVKNAYNELDIESGYQVALADANRTSEGRARRTARSARLRDYGGGKSYHEWKLNMTDFRGTREANDQQAIESETQVRVALPNATVTPAPFTATTMSLEEIEDLAFADLNGTSATDTKIANSNATNDENLPEPEMLVRPFRLRPRPIAERFDNLYLYVSDYPL